MLEFFRRFSKSRFGLIAVFIFLGVIAVAFGLTGQGGLADRVAVKANVVATVGGAEITDADLKQRVDTMINNLRSRGQQFTNEEFIAQGGFEAALDQTINDVAVEQFAKRGGMRVSRALVDSQIAGMPAFQGVDGKFDQKTFDTLLSRNRVSPEMLRNDMTRERYGAWVLGPGGVPPALFPKGVLAPYASLLLERRKGEGVLVRSIDMDPGANPDDKTLAAYYNSHIARYTVPERRIIRYAIVHPDQFKAQSAATEAEIANAYLKSGTRYAAKEKRTIKQLVLLDQATANSVAAQVKSGKAIADIAKGMGLEPTNFDAVEKADLARQTNPAVADAAFAAAQGGVAGPVKSTLGWHVLHVDKVEKIAAKTIDQARAELAGEITDRKVTTALVTIRQTLDDGAQEGSTFDDLIKQAPVLRPSVTPALLKNGANPDDPNFKIDPALAAVVQKGFEPEPEDHDPQVATLGNDGSFALVAIQKSLPPAPRPLAGIQKQVNADYLLDQAQAKARKAAAAVVADLDKGVPMQQALTNAGVKPGAKIVPFDLARSELEGKQVEPQVLMAFKMAPKKAKLLEAPNRSGYYVVYLAQIENHDASGDAATMDKVRGEIAPQIGTEQREQFLEAIRRDVVVKRNDAAIARVKASYSGGGDAGS